jgi:hypothetical protein
MSWHTSGLVIHLATPEKEYQAFLETLELEDPVFRKKASFDDAVSEEGIAIASMDGWTSVWGALLIVSDRVLKRLSKTANAYAFLMEGASGSYMFEWWTKGSCKRKRFIQEGEIGIDHGKPLPEENEVIAKEDDDEQRILLLLEKLTIPFRKLTKPEYHVFEVEDEFSSPLEAD